MSANQCCALTAIFSAGVDGAPLCGSGYRSPNGKTGERNEPAIYRSDAQYVTCVRCQKIA